MEKEKPGKSKKNMILKLLPKAGASTFIFQNHPFSPGREKRFHHNHKGFSGPIVSIIPVEARNRKSNNETNQEPTSPKVSCIGQIKQRKKKKVIKTTAPTPVVLGKISSKKSNFRNIFHLRRKPNYASSADDNITSSDVQQNRVPCLNQMKRFASGREGTLSNFDWKNVQITPQDHRKYYSDDDREDYCDEDEEEEEEVIIPFSAPILVGRDNRPNFPLEPKKEINLWKRRTMTKPNPLQLKK
ncbi:hypothetical protein K7X08_014777 [Anisodus acutangulus]|uniref:Syringolide-induced protein 14-1-1 n=1 Tax=Anisodus acutangulus TaxID=402998 RepID=A0A9Q1LJ35_9SOLA|nr:hypothetical protein K7X08_014777 [Anisodus acutangulus]